MKKVILSFFLICQSILYCQEPIYFNKVYNPIENFARGRGIVAVENEYYCLVNSDDTTNTWQSFVLMILDEYGEINKHKLFHIPGHNLYPGSVGGTLKRSNDGNFVFAYQAQGGGSTYSSLVKFNLNLDILWKKDYSTDFDWTLTTNCSLCNDGGYILTGHVKPFDSGFYDFLLLKTDSLGNMEWYQTYGTEWSEHGQNVIQTPDGGYLIGGYFWKPGIDHSLDAMVVKTDSLGNEEWTQYYGNPDIDDDMAFVELADDGNYLMATTFGEYIYSSNNRIGKFSLYKIDSDGEVIEIRKYGENRLDRFVKNFKKTENGFLCTGFSYITDSVSHANFIGWTLKLDTNMDSVWIHDYYHFNELWDANFLYDISPTIDKGYIAIGRSNEASTQANMWVLKLDSNGCDTPGCATGVQVFEYPKSDMIELKVWPNPTESWFKVQFSYAKATDKNSSRFKVKGEKKIKIYNSQGIKVKELKVPEGSESLQIDVSHFTNGLYYLQLIRSNQIIETTKIIKN